MFDLPTDTKKARKAYASFRKRLLNDGFTMMQYSVYVRHCASAENVDVHIKRVGGFLPPEGEVRLFTLTEKQFQNMQVFWGKRRKPPEPEPRQIELL